MKRYKNPPNPKAGGLRPFGTKPAKPTKPVFAFESRQLAPFVADLGRRGNKPRLGLLLALGFVLEVLTVLFKQSLHHDFPCLITHFHEIDSLGQFQFSFAVDFLCQNGLTDGVYDGQSAKAFNRHISVAWVGIEFESASMVLANSIIRCGAKLSLGAYG